MPRRSNTEALQLRRHDLARIIGPHRPEPFAPRPRRRPWPGLTAPRGATPAPPPRLADPTPPPPRPDRGFPIPPKPARPNPAGEGAPGPGSGPPPRAGPSPPADVDPAWTIHA